MFFKSIHVPFEFNYHDDVTDRKGRLCVQNCRYLRLHELLTIFSGSNDRSIDQRPFMDSSLNVVLGNLTIKLIRSGNVSNSTFCVKEPRASNNVFLLKWAQNQRKT